MILLDEVVRRVAVARDALDSFARAHYVLVASQIAILSLLFFYFLHHRFPLDPSAYPPSHTSTDPTVDDKMDTAKAAVADKAVKGLDAVTAQPDAAHLAPPKDDPFTTDELKKYDGKDENLPIYVAIKGRIYDVSAKRDMYGPGCGYNVFTGKDASKALGKSSLKPEDADADYSSLTDEEMKVLDDWEKYFQKRYNIVGKVVN
ncbi:hypothetical protein JCM10212_003182 [Sporobolomyces blumeae]